MTGSAGKLRALDGYVADSCYPSQFHQSFQPSWTDWNLERRGLAAPRTGRKPFKLVDLGCGDAHGLLLTAASHPEGQFVGIDAAPEHIARGHELAVAAGLTNVELRCADFRRARHFADESADYVTAQGVLAWVSPQNRSRLLDLAARWLRPGGAFTLGYNACPGWGRLAPFQKLVHALAQSASGTSSQRFTAALNRIRGDGMLPSEFWEWFDAQTDRHPPEYFAHEYLNDHWNPCWSGEIVSGMAQRGFAYVGQAIAVRLREDLYLKPEWRQTLATIGDAPTRELATDLLADTWYRHDIYVKSPTAPGPALHALTNRWWTLAALPEDIKYRMTTPAGDISFDNDAARSIVHRLEPGPGQLSTINAFTAADLLNSIDAMYMAGLAIPADPPGDPATATRFNAVLTARGRPVNAVASAHGAITAYRRGS